MMQKVIYFFHALTHFTGYLIALVWRVIRPVGGHFPR